MSFESGNMNYRKSEGPLFKFIIHNSSFVILLIILLMGLWLLGCSAGNETAGTSSGGQVINVSVKGIVQSDSGGGSNAVVMLYPKTYNPYLDPKTPDSLVDTTDEEGVYMFRNVDAGNYNLEVVNDAAGLKSLKQGILIPDAEDSVLVIEKLDIKKPGAIRLSLAETELIENGFVYIPGTSVYKKLSSQDIKKGHLLVDDVPAGSFSELVYGENDSSLYNLLTTDVSVVPEMNTLVSAYRYWGYTKKIIINTAAGGADITQNLIDFPLLVRLDSINFDFSEAQEKGNDIRFAKPDGTILSYEIERWDAINGMAEIWVKLDTLFGGNDTQYFTMHWGLQDAVDLSEGKAVFDTVNGFAGIWHLNEDANTNNAGYKDVTVYGGHGTGVSMDQKESAVVAGGQGFDGVDDYIDLGSKAGLDGAGSFTVIFWCNPDSLNFISMLGVLARGSD
ncbi:MAG: DUF2341 domain-containing protein, partial [Fibrobacteria bacterium]|nr:DUF2341 domain-containing protein [Fibrobacteria bacterium]